MKGLRCRFCSASLRDVVIDLGESPLSNALVDAAHLSQRDAMYPLRAYVCRKCWLVQVPQVASPERIFADYLYFSSYSSTWLEHVQRFARDATRRFGLGPASLVIEIACNDGALLKPFADSGVRVLGIEPAANVAAVASAAGIATRVEFFTAKTATALAGAGEQADLLVGTNVFAHAPDVNDFAEGLWLALKPQGVVVLEFPHLLRTIERGEFDTIYHEHFSYFSLATARRVLDAHGLEIFDVEELSTHGGSLRVFAAHRSARAPGARPEAIATVIERERAAGLETVEAYAAFAARAQRTKRDLRSFFEQARREGKRIAGYGAPAKATTLLNFCGIGPSELPYTVDRSPHKQGKYVPGVRVPIASPEKIVETKPEYVLVLPWNIKEEIAQQMAVVRTWGGRFVVPIPEVALL